MEVWRRLTAGPTFREEVLEAMASSGASGPSLAVVGNLLSAVKESEESVRALERETRGDRWQETVVVTPNFLALPAGLAAGLGKSQSLDLLLERGAALKWPGSMPLLTKDKPPFNSVSVLVEATRGALMIPELHGSRLRCLEMLANAGVGPMEADSVTGRTAPSEFVRMVSGFGPDAWAEHHHTSTHRPWEAVWERWLKASPGLARKVLDLETFDWNGRWTDLTTEQTSWVALRDANLLSSLVVHARASLAMERAKTLDESLPTAVRRGGSRL